MGHVGFLKTDSVPSAARTMVSCRRGATGGGGRGGRGGESMMLETEAADGMEAADGIVI